MSTNQKPNRPPESYPSETAVPWLTSLTIGEVLRETAARFPTQDAVVFPGLNWRLDWSMFDQEVDTVARALLAIGLQRCDRFGVWATNIPEWVLLQFATARIGVILVTINPSYRTNELAYAVRQSNLNGLALIDSFRGTDYFASLRELIPELESSDPGTLESQGFSCLKWVISLRENSFKGTISWETISLRKRSLSHRNVLRTLRDRCNARTRSTSNSLQVRRAIPKGATLSHRNILLNAYYAGLCQRLTPDDRICIPVPLYHCFGCVLGSLCAVVHGAAMIFPGESFHAGPTLQAIETERCTAIYGVPTMFIAMLEHAHYAERRLTSLRTGIMAGSPCPIELMKRVTGEMGASQLTIGYGQTEASPLDHADSG